MSECINFYCRFCLKWPTNYCAIILSSSSTGDGYATFSVRILDHLQSNVLFLWLLLYFVSFLLLKCTHRLLDSIYIAHSLYTHIFAHAHVHVHIQAHSRRAEMVFSFLLQEEKTNIMLGCTFTCACTHTHTHTLRITDMQVT